MKIAVLGACERTYYRKVISPGLELDIYDKARDMRTFDFSCPVIAHPPCAQWSRCRNFAKQDEEEKSLAFFCLQAVQQCGGIFEHPNGSLFVRQYIGYENCISVNQHWFGFAAKKTTLLYFCDCKPLSFPLNFDAVRKTMYDMEQFSRSRTPLAFNKWLVDCVAASFKTPQLEL